MNLNLARKTLTWMQSRLRAFISMGSRAAFDAVGLTASFRSVLTLYPGVDKNPFVVQDNPSALPITPTLSIDQDIDFTGMTGTRFMTAHFVRQYIRCSDVPAGSPSVYGLSVSQANNVDDSNKLSMFGVHVSQQVEHPTPDATAITGSSGIGSGFAFTASNTNTLVGVRGSASVGHQWSNCLSGTAVIAEVSNTGSAYGTADEVVGLEVRTNFRGSNDVVNGAINIGRYRGIAFTQPVQFGTEAPNFDTFIGIHFESSWDHLADDATVEAWLMKSDSYLPSYFRGKFTFDNTVVAPADTGNKTINKPSGQVRIAAGNSSVVVTNSQVTADSVIIATVASNDATLKTVAVVAGTGSFTIHGNAAATAETLIKWMVFN